MYTSEFVAGILFLEQMGLALAGAAAFWGFYLASNTDTTDAHNPAESMALSRKLSIPFFAGALLGVTAWIIRISSGTQFFAKTKFLNPIKDTIPVTQGISIVWFLFFAFVIGYAFFSWYRRRAPIRIKLLPTLHLVSFIFCFLLLSFPTTLSQTIIDKFFFIKKGFPLIFTVGTVVLIDFIFFYSRKTIAQKKVAYPLLQLMEKLVILGLGLSLFFEWADITKNIVNHRFFFIQTINVLIILNAALLSRTITNKLNSNLEKGESWLTKGWERVFEFSNILGFSAWTTISYLAFLPNYVPVYYMPLMIFFIIKTIFVYGGYLGIKHHIKRRNRANA